MKKNIIIALLTVISMTSISFGLYQKSRADRNEAMAIENERIAREMAVKGQEQLKRAEQLANVQRRRAEEQLERATMAEKTAMDYRKMLEKGLKKNEKK